jgi:hypothetical protein
VEKPVLEVANVRLGQVLVLADEDDHGRPEVLCFVLLKAVPDDLRFSDVSEVVASFGINSISNSKG